MKNNKNFNPIFEFLNVGMENIIRSSQSMDSLMRSQEIIGIVDPMFEFSNVGMENTIRLSQTMGSLKRPQEIMRLINPMFEFSNVGMENTIRLSQSMDFFKRLQEIMVLDNSTHEFLSQTMKLVAETSTLNSVYKSNLNVGVSDIFQINNSINDMRETLDNYGQYYFKDEDIEEFNNLINLKEAEVEKGEINEVQIFILYITLQLLVAILMIYMNNGAINMDIECLKEIICQAVINILMDQISFSNIRQMIKDK